MQRTPDRRTALLAHHAGIMRTWDALIARHGVEQVGPILAGLVQATDSQFRRLIDDPARHEELERQLDELDRLLRERRNAFGD